jgi:hypothetical protein
VLRIRAIASVGVMLCAAITSYSIYLGIAEHVYTPTRFNAAIVPAARGLQIACYKVQVDSSATTVPHAKSIPCENAQNVPR